MTRRVFGLPRIVGVATATPARRFTQAELLELAGYHDPHRRGFFEHGDVETRALALDPARFRDGETVDDLNERYRAAALDLGEMAVRRAVTAARWRLGEVDFLATTSCTGRLTPSLDAHLIARLGLRPDVQRVHVGDTGCASAMVALQQAANHLRAFPDHRAVVAAVEICSAAYYFDDRLETAVAHAIFADGAGALAVANTGLGPVIVDQQTLFRSEHLGVMGFEYPAGRPRVRLAKEVRHIAPRMMGELTATLLDAQGLKRQDIEHWILHSAGRRVLDRAASTLGLSEQALAPARAVLRRYGNMSSATVLFVLEKVLRTCAPVFGAWGVMLALGPGFAAEGAVLRW